MKLIKNGIIILRDRAVFNKVLVFDKKIIDIIDESNIYKYKKEKNLEEIQIIDAKGNYVSPGFIDIHVHGSGGSDVMDGTLDAIEKMSISVSESGVTSFLPTTMTMDKISIYKTLSLIKQSMNIKFKGAKVLGANMEGPFINSKYKGAQNEKYILRPDYDFIKTYKDIIKILTLAPEMDEDYEFIKQVKRNTDIILSMGHTDATFQQAMEAIKFGVTHATHTFNAMPPFHHRSPGVVGAVISSFITCELIADNVHVHPSMFNMLIKTKGNNNVVLITDSMRAANLNDGEYEFGGQMVVVKNNLAKLKNGTLAGSTLKLNDAVKNIFNYTNLNLNEAISMVSINPARVLGINNKKGSLEIGKDADIVIFDKKFEVKATIVEGEIIFKR